MQNPLLSICIPTYNRANELRMALFSISKQIEHNPALNKQIEVVISDNASSDNTGEIVDTFRDKIANLIYSKNDTNIGFDRNVLDVVSKSTGEYCLTLGDDDGILDGGLAAMLDTIVRTKSPYIMLNHWGYDHTLTSPAGSHPNRQQDEDITYSTLREYVSTIKTPMALVGTFGGMSVQLFKRQAWLDLKDKEKFIGTNTIHLFVILSAFKEMQSTLMKTPTIMSRNANLRWDSFPGHETENKRTQKTIEAAIWINELYGFVMNPYKIKIGLTIRGISNILKGYIKKILHSLKLRNA